MSENSCDFFPPIPRPGKRVEDPPVVELPVQGASYASPVTFKGTGLPEWDVYFSLTPVNGDKFGGAEVKPDGSWEFTHSLKPGEVGVFGWQETTLERSAWTSVIRFTVK